MCLAKQIPHIDLSYTLARQHQFKIRVWRLCIDDIRIHLHTNAMSRTAKEVKLKIKRHNKKKKTREDGEGEIKKRKKKYQQMCPQCAGLNVYQCACAPVPHTAASAVKHQSAHIHGVDVFVVVVSVASSQPLAAILSHI